MTVVAGDSKCNLITGYSEGEDNQQNYGKHKWLAQTFTLNELNVVFRCRFKSWTVQGDNLHHYAIRATDIGGKPTGLDLAHTTLSPGRESFYSPGKWRRFDFMTFPNLPAGIYALVTSVPDAYGTNRYKLRCDATASQYPPGKAWESNDSGVTWDEIPNTDFIFEVWGWEPPPVSDPTPAISNWAPLSLTQPEVPECHTITVTTDIPVHLFMRWTDKKPLTHATELIRRGISLPNATRWCFVAWHEVEQEEAGDTLTHTFILCDWIVCETRYFYFIGTKQAEESPSASPIFYYHREGVPMYVINLGKLGEAEVLHGEVKLKEGSGILITRDDPNNALEIATTPVPYEGFGNHWLKHDPSGELAASIRWCFDEVSFATSTLGVDLRLYTTPMRSWGFRRPCSCEFKLTRGPDASGNPLVYAAIVGITADLHGNLDQPCVGWSTNADGLVSCFNGDGTGFKKTDFAWGNWPPVWLKWVLSATDIKFYANGVLVATHTTFIPTQDNSCFFALQAIGTTNYPRTLYMTHPHYSAD